MFHTKDEKEIVQKKISAIIPTIQANTELLTNLIKALDKDNAVHEIIVINNSEKPLPEIATPKIKIIDFGKNLYVNKSWNIGVQESSAEFYALINDDLILPNNFCSNILPFLSKDKGLYGLDKEYMQNIDNPDAYDEEYKIYIQEADARRLYYGVIMIGHRDNYYVIPDNLKIFCGDDYLFFMNKQNGKINYKISGCPIKHCHQLSSKKPEFYKITKQDCLNYRAIDKSYKIPNKFKHPFKKFIQFIANTHSKTEDEYRVKYLQILGFKFILNKKAL